MEKYCHCFANETNYGAPIVFKADFFLYKKRTQWNSRF